MKLNDHEDYFCLQYFMNIITGGINIKIVPKVFIALKLINKLPNHANRDRISPTQLLFLAS